MRAVEEKRVSILNMAKGAREEEVNLQMAKVAQNLIDPNTDWKKARKLIVTLDFVTDEQREITRVTATAEAKLVPSKPVSSQITFGYDENGEMCAVELTRAVPGQMDMLGGVEADPQIIKLSKMN